MNNPLIVDLSHHNDLTLPEVLAAGAVGIIHKATQGTGYVDNMFAPRREEARSLGVPFASYHFLEAGNPSAQMQHYLDTVQPVPGERMVIDHESTATLGELREAVSVLQKAGAEVAIYSGHTIKDQLGNSRDSLLATCSLWIAQYTNASAPTWPTGTWPTWTLWQYTDAFAIGSKKVDANRFNGSEKNAVRWLSPAQEDNSTEAEQASVSVNITTVGDCKVNVTVNGKSQS